MKAHVEHNLTLEELSKALISVAKCHHIEDEMVEVLTKALKKEEPTVPRHAAMRGLYFRFQGEYRAAMDDIMAGVGEILGEGLEKSHVRSHVSEPKTCDSCIHFNMRSHTCKAFPEMVPLPFLYGTAEHTSSVPGDGGIVYQRIEDAEWLRRLKAFTAGEGE